MNGTPQSEQGYPVNVFVYSIKNTDLIVSSDFSCNFDKDLKWNITNIWVTLCVIWKQPIRTLKSPLIRQFRSRLHKCGIYTNCTGDHSDYFNNFKMSSAWTLAKKKASGIKAPFVLMGKSHSMYTFIMRQINAITQATVHQLLPDQVLQCVHWKRRNNIILRDKAIQDRALF